MRVRRPLDGVYPERSRGAQDKPGVAIKPFDPAQDEGSILASAAVEVERSRDS